MQFRLETFKNENMENKYKISKNQEKVEKSEKGVPEKNKPNLLKNIFYTKILSNTNIGIEFHKPYL
jgi:hypothetical protein